VRATPRVLFTMILNKAASGWILGILCLSGSALAEDGSVNAINEIDPMEQDAVHKIDRTEQGTCKDVCYGLWCECVKECFSEENFIEEQGEEHETCMINCEERYPELMKTCGELCGDMDITDLFEYFGTCDGSYTTTPSGSVTPSESPSCSQTPTVSAAPTVDCTCCDCTHTSGCHNDPHYRTWNNIWFDFQGACDQIAIDNHILQLQIRTRPRQWYSTVTEVGLRIKRTGEIFHARINQENDIVVNSDIAAASDASYSQLSGDHRIKFIDGEDSYILIRKSGTGMSVSVHGQGYIFTDSEGMFGSWNYGGVRYSNGTVFDLSNGYWDVRERAIELAESWMVPQQDSLMDSPSTVCDPHPECGPDELFDCNEVGNRLRRLEINPGCDKTCDDIPSALLREACEKDLELTGDATWACEADYVDPIIVESNECEFEKLDDGECYKDGNNCQRLGGFCKLDCESTDYHACLPGLCSTHGPFQKGPHKLPMDRKKDSKTKGNPPKPPMDHKKAKDNPPKSPMALKKSKKCECFVPIKCPALP